MRRRLASWSAVLPFLAFAPLTSWSDEPKLEPPQRVSVGPAGVEKAAPAKADVPVKKAISHPLAGRSQFAVGGSAAGQTARLARLARLDAADPRDPRVRLLVLTPRGPLIVAATLTIDGQPFLLARKTVARVDEFFAAADTNLDGEPTWEEAIDHPRFACGGYRSVASSPAQRMQTLRSFDVNGDGRMDRAEVLRLIDELSAYRCEPFDLYREFNSDQLDLRSLLDADSDGVLSEQERLAASQRLQSLDANEDDLVDSSELDRRRRPYEPSLSLRIDQGIDPAALHSQLVRRYRRQGALRTSDLGLTPHTAEQLDQNQNGQIEPGELAALAKIAPHVELECNFGRTGRLPEGLTVKHVAEELGDATKIVVRNDPVTTLTLPGVNLELIGVNQIGINQTGMRLSELSTETLKASDADKNGYLERKEATDIIRWQAGRTHLTFGFDAVDRDGDGKVFTAEINAIYEWILALEQGRITAVGVEDNPLLAVVDASGDGRLSLREMQQTAERLKQFDKNQDGQIAGEEIPGSLWLTFSQDGLAYGGALPKAKPTAGPDWFVRMDRNGDGDITAREFPGTAKQFSQLDADNDGVVTREEAERK